MSKLGTPVVVVIGIVAVTVVIVVGVVANAALTNDDERVVVEPAAVVEPTQPIGEYQDENPNPNAGVGDADDVALSRAELARAEAAALQIAGGGTVTEVDRSDDLGEAYEVEVQTDAGEVDVALSERFERVPNLRYDD